MISIILHDGAICNNCFVLTVISICALVTGRTYLNPIGWTDRAFVRIGNLMAARVAILCLLVAFRKCTFLVEQPVRVSAIIIVMNN